MNLSAILPGVVQSNQRAELLAVVLTCLRDPRRLDIRSDSEYVCKGLGVMLVGLMIMRIFGTCLLASCAPAQLVFVCLGSRDTQLALMCSAAVPPRK